MIQAFPKEEGRQQEATESPCRLGQAELGWEACSWQTLILGAQRVRSRIQGSHLPTQQCPGSEHKVDSTHLITCVRRRHF